MAASLSGEFNTQAFTDAGAPAAGYRLYTFSAGTTTQKTAYTDAAASVAHVYTSDGAGGLYIALNSRGELPAPLFFATGAYDITLKTAAGATVWTRRAQGMSDTGLDLSSTTDATKGAGLSGFGGAMAYASKTVGGRLRTIGADPRQFGATADGVADDSAAIATALLHSKTLDLRNGTWHITSPITVPSGDFVIDARGATISVANGASAAISFTGAKDGLTILGGVWTGTCGAWLDLASAVTTPTAEVDYARQIRLQGVQVAGVAVSRFIDMTNAVRQVFIDSCQAFTVNGINASGKCVEVMVTKSIIFGATGAAGTYGVKLRSPAGTTYFNEGWHFTDCTIDNFDTTFNVTDIFALTVTGGYVSGISYAFDFGQPTSASCHHITLGRFTCAGKVRFAPTGGYSYHGVLSDITFTSIAGVNLQFANNAASVRASNLKFDSSSSGVAIEAVSNNANIVVEGIDCDSSFIGGVQVKGASGAGCMVSDISYAGSGDAIYTERPVLLKSIPTSTANTAAFNRQHNATDLAANYIVGATIASLTVSCAKGELGYIDIALSASGMNAATQRLDITVPAGMVVPSGTAWDSRFIVPAAAAFRIGDRIPYYCTADIAGGTLSIANGAGNTVTIGSHSRFGIVRAW